MGVGPALGKKGRDERTSPPAAPGEGQVSSFQFQFFNFNFFILNFFTERVIGHCNGLPYQGAGGVTFPGGI